MSDLSTVNKWKVATEMMLGETMQDFTDNIVWGSSVAGEVNRYCVDKKISLAEAYQEVQEKKSGLTRKQRDWLSHKFEKRKADLRSITEIGY